MAVDPTKPLQDPNSLGGWWNQMSGRGALNSQNSTGVQNTVQGDIPADPPLTDYNSLQEQAGIVQDAGTTAENERFRTEGVNKETAEMAHARTQGRLDHFRGTLDGQSTQIDQGLARFQNNVQGQRAAIAGMYGDFQAQMDQSSQFIQGLQATALEGARAGESGALQGAVQGIQGNVRNATAQIDNNINLTPAQRTQMKAQVRVQGGLGMAPVTGKIKADFQAQVNDINKSFGGMLSQLENVRGTVGGTMQTAVGQMGTQLTQMLGNAQSQRDSAQANLLATRGQLEMTNNAFELGMLPELDSPYIDMTGVEITDFALDNEILSSISSERMMRIGFDIQQMGLSDAANTSIIDMIVSILSAVA